MHWWPTKQNAGTSGCFIRHTPVLQACARRSIFENTCEKDQRRTAQFGLDENSVRSFDCFACSAMTEAQLELCLLEKRHAFRVLSCTTETKHDAKLKQWLLKKPLLIFPWAPAIKDPLAASPCETILKPLWSAKLRNSSACVPSHWVFGHSHAGQGS